jgi:hypothetical protein
MTHNGTVLSRRGLLRITGGLAAPLFIPALAAYTLAVNSYGAEFQEIITGTTIGPFQKKFGVKVACGNPAVPRRTTRSFVPRAARAAFTSPRN